MNNWALVLAGLACAAGCRAPMPQMKDLSPYGATRVEPPQTGSFGTADAYYQPPAATGGKPAANARGDASAPSTLIVASDTSAAAAEGPSFRTPQARTASAERTPSGRVRASIGSSSTPGREIAQASFEQADAAGYAPGSTLSIIEATPPAPARVSQGSSIELSGMPVNDATQLAEPAAFTPRGTPQALPTTPTGTVELSDLPQPSAAVRSRLNTVPPPPSTSGWRLR